MSNIDPDTERSRPEKAQFKPLKLDMDKHSHHVAGFDLSDEDESELLNAVWQLMVKAVDLGITMTTQSSSASSADGTSVDIVGLLFEPKNDRSEE